MSTNFLQIQIKIHYFENLKVYLKIIKISRIFDALDGFFRASGYFSIRPYLENVPKIRILVGINVDKIISKYQAKGLLFQSDSQQTINEFLNILKQIYKHPNIQIKLKMEFLKFWKML